MSLEQNPIYQQAQQMEILRGLTSTQQRRLQAYMRLGGLSFAEAHAAVLLTDPPISHTVLLVVTPIHVTLPQGRRQTRRQRKRATS